MFRSDRSSGRWARAAAVLLVPGVALAGFEVSSFKVDSRFGADNFGAAAAIDSRPETTWMVDSEASNEGQWIQMDVPNSTVDKIGVVIGWDKSENDFFDYARVKKAKIGVYNLEGNDAKLVKEQEVSFEDKRGWQIVEIDDTKLGGDLHGGRVRLTVVETYPGKDYPNLAMAEMRVYLKEFPAETMSVATPPDAAGAGHGVDLLSDGKDTTFWASDGAAKTSFSLKANGYGLASVGLHTGAKGYGRPKTVKLKANDLEVTHTLEDKDGWQWLILPVMVGYTGGAWGTVQVEVLDAYGDTSKGIAINEVKLNAATIEDI